MGGAGGEEEADGVYFAVLDGEGGDGEGVGVAEGEGGVGDGVGIGLDVAGVAVFAAEGVVEHAGEVIEDGLAGVEGEGVFGSGGEAAEFIEAEDVIHVGVGVDDGVCVGDAFAKALGAEIGAGIDEDAEFGGAEEDGGAGAIVAGVGGGADVAIASDHGDTDGGAGAEEGDVEGEIFWRNGGGHFDKVCARMAVMSHLGKRHLLPVVKIHDGGIGVYVDAGGKLGELLLPKRYVPEGVELGTVLDVFLYRDSEDRPMATTERPFAEAGQFAWLEVIGVHPKIGAFLDWGLPKDLLLPYSEQPNRVRLGEGVLVYVLLDEKSMRVVATAKLGKYLSHDPAPFNPGDSVDILVAGRTDRGIETIVENAHRGMLFHNELPSPPPAPGTRMKAFVKDVRADGKVDLTVHAMGYGKVKPLGEQILEALRDQGGELPLNDKSSPEAIREAFGVSKKAFKQALGALYRQRQVTFSEAGTELS